MSGSNQHYIPQSLLKGFGVKRRKKTYVVAYTYDRGTFSPPTDGIGAERHFYSELGVKGEDETLNDRITAYEQPFPKIFELLRSTPHDQSVDAKMAAEFVTHLAVRNDHFRKSVASGSANLIEGLAGSLADSETAKAILGLSGDQPSATLAEELAELWTQLQPILEMQGISETQFSAWAFEFLKANFNTLHNAEFVPLAEIFGSMVQNLPDVAANSQRNALAKGLSPPLRVQKMSDFQWRVLHPEMLLILPDCVSVAFDGAGEVLQLMLADLAVVRTILMPLSATRLLIGSRGEHSLPTQNVNDAFASCSWDFFVARERTEKLEQSRKLLRTRVTAFMQAIVSEVLDEAIETGA